MRGRNTRSGESFLLLQNQAIFGNSMLMASDRWNTNTFSIGLWSRAFTQKCISVFFFFFFSESHYDLLLLFSGDFDGNYLLEFLMRTQSARNGPRAIESIFVNSARAQTVVQMKRNYNVDDDRVYTNHAMRIIRIFYSNFTVDRRGSRRQTL